MWPDAIITDEYLTIFLIVSCGTARCRILRDMWSISVCDLSHEFLFCLFFSKAEKQIWLLPVYPSNAHNSWGSVRLKPEALNSFQISHVSAWEPLCAPSLCPRVCVVRIWAHVRRLRAGHGSGDLTHSPMGTCVGLYLFPYSDSDIALLPRSSF